MQASTEDPDLDDAPAAVSAVPREIELKLFVPPSSVARLWMHPLVVQRAVAPLRVARLVNRYFDTPAHDLAARQMALRLRRAGRCWVQTLKSADAGEGALSTRGEWEMPVAGPALELARLRATPLAAVGSTHALAERLRPVFTTNFRRESQLLRMAGGAVVEFAFDVGTISAGRGRTRRSLPICEVEIEVKTADASGAAPDLMKFAARLAEDLALIPLAASKAARGYRIAEGVALAPTKVDLPVPQAGDPPRLHLARVLAAGNRALLANVHGLFELAGEGADDAGLEFVHQARVAIRRMRSALLTFRPVAKGRRFDLLDRELRAIGRTFGHARDWDVFATTLLERVDAVVATDAPGKDAMAALRGAVVECRADARTMLMHALDAGPFGATTIAVERMVARLSAGRAGKGTLGAVAPDWLSAQRDRVVRRARRIAVLDTEERHGLRVEVKRLRYALDLLEGLYERTAVADLVDALADLQDKLGMLNDASVAAALLEALEAFPELALVRVRFDAWLARHVHKQLPKVAALSVAFELTPLPWGPPLVAAADRSDAAALRHGGSPNP